MWTLRDTPENVLRSSMSLFKKKNMARSAQQGNEGKQRKRHEGQLKVTNHESQLKATMLPTKGYEANNVVKANQMLQRQLNSIRYTGSFRVTFQ